MLKIIVLLALFALIFFRWSAIYATRMYGKVRSVQRMTYAGMIVDMLIVLIIVLMR